MFKKVLIGVIALAALIGEVVAYGRVSAPTPASAPAPAPTPKEPKQEEPGSN